MWSDKAKVVQVSRGTGNPSFSILTLTGEEAKFGSDGWGGGCTCYSNRVREGVAIGLSSLVVGPMRDEGMWG